MSYIVNYSKWRAMHEAAIFEKQSDDPITQQGEVVPGANVDAFKTDPGLTSSRLSETINRLKTSEPTAWSKILQAITKIHIDNKRYYPDNETYMDSPANWYHNQGEPEMTFGTKNAPERILYTLIAASVGQFTGSQLNQVKMSDITWERLSYTVKLTPKTTTLRGFDKQGVAVKGLVSKEVKNLEKNSSTFHSTVAQYATSYNMLARFKGSPNGQYDGSAENFTDGYFDFALTPYKGDGIIVFIPRTASEGTIARTETDVTKVIAGVSADGTQADVGFEVGLAVMTAAGKTKVAELAKTILEKFKGQTVTGFNLISSASPEYGAIKNVAGWEKNYDVITGTSDPGKGTTDAAKNKKLAYDRGVSFMNELNTQLAAQGHAGFPDYTITWKIASTGGPNDNGRFVDLNLATNEQKPRIEKVGTKVEGTETAGKVTGDLGTFELSVFKFTVKKPETVVSSGKGKK